MQSERRGPPSKHLEMPAEFRVVESKEGQKVSKTPQLDKRIVNQNSSAVQCSK